MAMYVTGWAGSGSYEPFIYPERSPKFSACTDRYTVFSSFSLAQMKSLGVSFVILLLIRT